MQAATATLSWLVGRHDFFVNVVTEGSSSSSSSSSSRSSSSDGAPKAPMGGNFKLDMPVSTDGKMRSSSTINLSADATDGPQTLKQATAKSSKKKSGKQNKRKGSESVRNRTKAAGHEAADCGEEERGEGGGRRHQHVQGCSQGEGQPGQEEDWCCSSQQCTSQHQGDRPAWS